MVVEGEEGLKALVTDYYSSLFTPVAGFPFGEFINIITPKVTAQMNSFLMAEFTADEVKKALDSIGDLKAPGADGMPAIFYKKYCQLVGDSVIQEVLHVLHGGSVPEGWNDTLVVLIPKVKNPERLKDLRPISLCNIVYKLVSKVIANRLKCILGEIISDNQSAFVPGRLISDNTLLAYEMTHFLKRKRVGGAGYAALKLDMSKAYDRVEWSFLERMLNQLGFCEGFVQLISKCIRSIHGEQKQWRERGRVAGSLIPSQSLKKFQKN